MQGGLTVRFRGWRYL